MLYSRDVPYDVDNYDSALFETMIHVREHMSSCVDPDDSCDRHFSEVTLSYEDLGDRLRVTGSLDREVPDYALDAVPVESIDDVLVGDEVSE